MNDESDEEEGDKVESQTRIETRKAPEIVDFTERDEKKDQMSNKTFMTILVCALLLVIALLFIKGIRTTNAYNLMKASLEICMNNCSAALGFG